MKSNLEASTAANEHGDEVEENHVELSPKSPIYSEQLQLVVNSGELNYGTQLHSKSHHLSTEELSLCTVPSLLSQLSISSHLESVDLNVDKNDHEVRA